MHSLLSLPFDKLRTSGIFFVDRFALGRAQNDPQMV